MKTIFVLLLFTANISWASLCQDGRQQSPIHITPDALVSPALPAMAADYQEDALKLANDGHTLRVRLRSGPHILRLGTERYTLQQFHFHTPGGDQIDGEAFPFAAHLLHKSATGHLLAVTVPFRLGAENALLRTLLPLIPPRVDGDHLHPGINVHARQLLPSDPSYYRYAGSLTDTPCTEGVTWLVMKHPLQLSAAQLATWRKHFADNMRGPQPLRGRRVKQSL